MSSNRRFNVTFAFILSLESLGRWLNEILSLSRASAAGLVKWDVFVRTLSRWVLKAWLFGWHVLFIISEGSLLRNPNRLCVKWDWLRKVFGEELGLKSVKSWLRPLVFEAGNFSRLSFLMIILLDSFGVSSKIWLLYPDGLSVILLRSGLRRSEYEGCSNPRDEWCLCENSLDVSELRNL